MSKYDPLWKYIADAGKDTLKLTFEEIQAIIGNPIDHSFLRFKKELWDFGFEVGKISQKEQTVQFRRK